MSETPFLYFFIFLALLSDFMPEYKLCFSFFAFDINLLLLEGLVKPFT